MKVVAVSDIHGRLPKIKPCDVLIIAGDSSPLEYDRDLPLVDRWLDDQFEPWLRQVPARHVIGIAGNHDFIFQASEAAARRLPWTYLLDSGVVIDDVSFWGTPWIPNLKDWAFYADDDRLAEAYSRVSSGVDVVISHGPPVGYVTHPLYKEWCSQSVNDMLKRVKPQVFVCGHIHEGYGTARFEGMTTLYNVSHCDVFYDPVNPSISFTIEHGQHTLLPH